MHLSNLNNKKRWKRQVYKKKIRKTLVKHEPPLTECQTEAFQLVISKKQSLCVCVRDRRGPGREVAQGRGPRAWGPGPGAEDPGATPFLKPPFPNEYQNEGLGTNTFSWVEDCIPEGDAGIPAVHRCSVETKI